MTQLKSTALRSEVFFVTGDLPDLATLLGGLPVNAEVHVLDATQDGLTQMASLLAGRSGLDAIHILSHGSSGALQLGTSTLNDAALTSRATDLAQIGQSLAAEGDILLYGCNVAAGDAGARFIGKLAQATGADVAASDDLTGAAALSGNWVLEVRLGDIETPAISAAQAGLYREVLNISSAIITFATSIANLNDNGGTIAANNVEYMVGGDSAYMLKIDGADSGVLCDVAVTANLFVDSGGIGESLVSFSFPTGQNFTPSTLKLKNPTGGLAQTLVFTGYDASGAQIGSPISVNQPSGDAATSVVSFTGLSSIAVLKMTSTTNGNKIQTLILDTFALGNIGIPISPSATIAGVTLSADTGASASDFITKTASQDVNITLSEALAAGEQVQVSMDGGLHWTLAYLRTSTTYRATDTLLAGNNTLQARITTNVGGTSTVYTHAYTLDTTAPSAPSAPDMLASDDHGRSSTDNITNVLMPVFSGTAEAGSTVSLYRGGNGVGSGVADSSGNWSFASGATGSGPLTALATDVAGNVSSASAALSNVTIDSTPPASPSPDLLVADDSGNSSTDNVTSVTTPRFSGTVTSGDYVKLYDGMDGPIIGTATAANWTITSSALASGLHYIQARAEDIAGNLSVYSAPLPVTISNSTGPTINYVTSSNASRAYKTGETISIWVVFYQPVAVTGTPQITLETGTTDRTANFTGMDPSFNYIAIFDYVVQPGDIASTLDYVSATALDLNGGTIKDIAGTTDAVLSLSAPGTSGSLGSHNSIAIDTVPPSIIADTLSGAPAANATAINFLVRFNETVTGVGYDANDLVYCTDPAYLSHFALTATGSATGIIAKIRELYTGDWSGSSYYLVMVTNVSGEGTLRLDLNSSGNAITDPAGNVSVGGYTSGAVHTVSSNTAPTLTTVSTLTGATEDAALSIPYATLAAAANEADVDSGATLSFRVDALTTGTLYTNVGLTMPVTPGTTLLSIGGTWYWKPATDANGSALNAFTVKAYDGALASSTAIQVKVDVAAANDAPTLSGGATLTAIAEDVVSLDDEVVYTTYPNMGDDIATLLGTSSFADVDQGSTGYYGIAIVANTANASTEGKWKYSNDPNTEFWHDLGSVSASAALLLSTNGSYSTFLRFVPVANFTGTPGGLTVYAVDSSTAGQSMAYTRWDGSTESRHTFDTTTDDATSPVSASGVSWNVSVTAVNDAPVISNLSSDSLTVAASAAAMVIDQGTAVSVTDVDNANFNGGTLTVSFVSRTDGSGDVLGIHTGAGVALSSGTASGSIVTVGTTDIGTIANNGTGAGTFNLVVRFNSSATPALVSTLLQNITYDNTAGTPTAGARTVRFVLTDGSTGNSGDIEATVTVTTNVAPVVTTPTAIALTDTAAADTFSNTSGTLSATDTDGIASYGISSGTTGGSFLDNAITYDVSKAGSYGTLYVKSSNGAYLFVPNASAVNALASGTQSDTFSVTATDSNASPASGSATLTVNVTGVNDNPTNISLSAATVNQSAAANAVVGSLSSTDAETGQTFTYSLVSGAGDTNNASFTVNRANLQVNNPSSLTAGAYAVLVRSTDSGAGSLSYDKAITVTVVDNVAPTVTSIVRQTPSTSPTNVDSLVYRVTFNEAVANVNAADFSVSGTTGTVSAVSAVSSTVYDITVSGGDLANYNGTATLSFAGGQNIADTATAPNALAATTPTGTNNPSYTLDNAAPAIASVTVPDASMKVGSVVTATITTSSDADTYTLSAGTIDGFALGSLSKTSATSYTASFTVTEGGADFAAGSSIPVNLVLMDSVGNANAAYTTAIVQAADAINAHTPSAINLGNSSVQTIAGNNAVVGALSSTDGTTGDSFIYTLVAGTGSTDNASFNINGSDLRATTPSGLTAGSYAVRIRTTDAGGNYFEDSKTVAVTTNPTVTITSSATAFKSGESATVTFTFSETPTGFDGSDITTTGGSLGSLTVDSSNNKIYTATFTPTANTNGLSGSILVTANTFTNASSQANLVSNTLSISGDTLAPTLAITSNVAALKISETATITFTFSEDPGATFTWDGSAGDVVVSGGILSTLSGTGLTRTATFTPTASTNGGTASITVAFSSYTDAAGNSGDAGSTPTLTFDTLAPTLAITSNVAALKISETANITFTFSEDPGSTFAWNGTMGDVVVSGGTLGAISGTGLTRTATFTPTANINGGAASISVANSTYTDAAGNSGGAGTTPALTFDTLAPTLAISTVATDDKINATEDDGSVSISGTSSGADSHTVAVSVAGGTAKTGTIASGGGWSVSLSSVEAQALNEGNLSITADVSDAAGNPATQATKTIVYDKTVPTLGSITRATLSSPTGSNSFTIDLAYADSGTGVDGSSITNGDITVTGPGAVGALIVSGASYNAGTHTATYTINAPVGGWSQASHTGNYTVALGGTEVRDLAGNAVVANTSAHSFAVSFNPVPNASGSGTGDGNGDDILDDAQINVASLGTVGTVGADKRFATLEVANGLTLANVANTAAPGGLPRNVKMPLGQFDFDIGSVTPGATVTVSMYVDKTLGVNGYYKLNGTAWTNIATVTTLGNKSKITFSLTDGGLYDADGVVNGIIKDPGGAALIGPLISSNGGGTTASVGITENNSAVTTVVASVPPTLAGVSYSLTGGADQTKFVINPTSGALSFVSAPNFENPLDLGDTAANNTYVVEVTAGDSQGGSDMQAITVSVTNLDEVAPSITSGATASAINENSSAAQVVYTATSTDTGDTATGSTVYSLKAATGDVAAFSINAATGAVTLTGNPNFEAKSSYSFTVVATDAANNASEKAVTLAINNLDEVAPTITSAATASAIAENSGAGQTIYTTTSTDTGDAASAGVSYSLKAVDDSAAFSINSTSGAVTITGNPNFETKASYSFTVLASDGVNAATEKALTLAITNVNEAPTGAVSIGGTPTQGQSLNASDTLADPDGLGSISYQWSASGTVVGSGASYILTKTDVGKAISVVASYLDGGGTTESVGSAPTDSVAALVDGTVVQLHSTTQGSQTTTTQTIAPISSIRSEDNSTANTSLADIPLATDSAGATLLQVSLPVGVGLTSSSSETAFGGTAPTLREQLIAASDPRVNDSTQMTQIINNGIDQYVPTVTDSSQVTVRTITLTVAAGTTTAPTDAIHISGSLGTGEGDTGHPLRQEALVIDASRLPSGTVLDLDNVEFAIIIGPATATGGAGRNYVIGDGSAQTIILGPEDDVIHGGAGNDTVGSKGGNDQLFGDEGNDTVVGGLGDDHLEGGAGDDLLVGGQSDGGRLTFSQLKDQLTMTWTPSSTELADSAGWSNTGKHDGGTPIDPRLGFMYQSTEMRETVSELYHLLLNKLPTVEEMNFWSTLGYSVAELEQGAANMLRKYVLGLPTQYQVKVVMEQLWGAGKATDAQIQSNTSMINAGGNWGQLIDALIKSDNFKAALLNADGSMTLTQVSSMADSGWAFDTGNDTLLGGAGNDTLIGGRGNDVLDGGDGTDSALWYGQAANFEVKIVGSGTAKDVALVDTSSGEVDIIRNIEQVQIGGVNFDSTKLESLSNVEAYLASHTDHHLEVVLVGLAG